MNIDRVLSMLSLAKKAGRTASGGFLAEEAVRSGKACLVIISTDASENTGKKFRNMCKFRGIPYVMFGEKDSLGKYTGSELKSVVAVTDPGFAGSILKMLSDIDNREEER